MRQVGFDQGLLMKQAEPTASSSDIDMINNVTETSTFDYGDGDWSFEDTENDNDQHYSDDGDQISTSAFTDNDGNTKFKCIYTVKNDTDICFFFYHYSDFPANDICKYHLPPKI